MVGMVFLWAGLAPVTARAATEEQIKTGIARAIAKIKQTIGSHAGGQLALSTLALLKAEVPATDPVVADALNRLSGNVRNGVYAPVDHHRYEAGVTLMAFGSADPVKFKPQIEAVTAYILESQEAHGGWFYPAGQHGVAGSVQHGDTSISQYTLLGLWEASRAGINIPKKAWDRAAAWHLQTQLRDGAFTYHPSPTNVNPLGTHSMTVAGTASLLLARMMLYPEASDLPTEEVEEGPATAEARAAKKKKSMAVKYGILVPAPDDEKEPEPGAAPAAAKPKVLQGDDSGYKAGVKLTSVSNGAARGLKWLATNYRVNLSVGQGAILGQQWNSYYLYGLERMAALTGLVEIAGRDWYQDGCDFLLTTQMQDGGWNMDQAGDAADTCFGLMFMVKATEKTIKKIPKGPRRQKLAGGVLVGARGLPDDLANLQVGKVGTKPRKAKGAVDELLGELEKLDPTQIEAVQDAIVDTVVSEDPEALVGQQERLQQLSRDRRVEVRRTAVWGLGRTNNLASIPYLLERLEDVDLSVITEARNALRFMTRQPNFLELSETPTPEELAAVAREARRWYLSVRPYTERDDLQDLREKLP
ncbi:MAG TPA: hypothetical protein DDY91_21520 [Planctomycetaceae bacterium]|nr:hypothetical protein [Planctomycetaceae bacterium]